jgi:hypothetical protein
MINTQKRESNMNRANATRSSHSQNLKGEVSLFVQQRRRCNQTIAKLLNFGNTGHSL